MFLHGTATTTIDVSTGSQTIGGGSNGMAGDIAGDGSLTKAGDGTLILSGSSTYSGTTTVSAGTLYAGSDTGFSSASAFTVADGATLDIGGSNVAIGSLAGASGATVKDGDSIGSSLTTGSDDTSTTFSGLIEDGAHTLSLVKVGSGTFTIAGTSTYSGATIVEAGVLMAGSETGFSSASAFQVGQDGTLDVNGKDVTIGSLSDYDGGGIVTNADTIQSFLTLGADGTLALFSGAIQDGVHELGLTKTGGGTQILLGTNTYSLATMIEAGSLEVDGSIASATTVKSGGTLAGNGSVLADVIVEAGGILSPGSDVAITKPLPSASAAILSTGNVAFTGGATFAAELGGTTPGFVDGRVDPSIFDIIETGGYDQLKVTGTVTLGGATLDLSLLGDFIPSIGDVFRIIDNDGADAVSGIFAGLAEGARLSIGGRLLSITYHGGDGNDVVLSAVNAGVRIIGTNRADRIDGAHTAPGQPLPGAGDDTIFGRDGNDRIAGLAGDDTIIGGRGIDFMRGGADEDLFVFNGAADFGGLSPFLPLAQRADHILDFTHGVDRIDLSAMDASTAAGLQHFSFIGRQGFHQVAGELRYHAAGNNIFVVSGDINGDGRADFSLIVHQATTLNGGDFLLS